MAKVISVSGREQLCIEHGWHMAVTEAGSITSPSGLGNVTDWVEALVPGTVAETLRRVARWNPESPDVLDHMDYWYRTRMHVAGPRTLRFAGLATHAEVWLNGTLLLITDNMFLTYEVDVALSGSDELCLCFRALKTLMAKPSKRARWRPAMIDTPGLRSIRTTLLGHMPGWCPPIHPVGPWRPVTCSESSSIRIQQCRLHADLTDNNQGKLQAKIYISDLPSDCEVLLTCAGVSKMMIRDEANLLSAEMLLDGIHPWWPHTHGQPHRYSVNLQIGETLVALGKVGFRSIEVDHGVDGAGFSLKINRQKIFCRGACWTSADIVGLSGSRDVYLPWLQLMLSANMNMVRIGGTMLYEADAFYELCDELGVMVWQDFMFANFDYPAGDAEFKASVHQEVAQFLDRTQSSPSIVLLCGGSEVSQQAAMLGLPSEAWGNQLFDVWLPELCRQFRPDVPYIPNSPYGGVLPFSVNTGVAHYYGVGAYLRPLEDARRAEVKFAAECLAFANVPEDSTLQKALPVQAVHHPVWKQRVPRDRNATWDFEDVRDHYLKLLFNVDPSMLRRTDIEGYLGASRVVTGAVMESVFAEWRRARSPTGGGLVWTFQDLWPGAGWGVVDALGEPKAAWYALRRAFRSLQVAMTDEGVNGLAIHLINDTDQVCAVVLRLVCMRDATAIIDVKRSFNLVARQNIEIYATELIDAFFDINYAYMFGPRAHDVTMAVLTDAITGEQLAEAFHFPGGYNLTKRNIDLQVTVENREGEWVLCLKSDCLALFVSIQDEHFRPEDNTFHLLAGMPRWVKLLPRSGADKKLPNGTLRPLNSHRSIRYQAKVM